MIYLTGKDGIIYLANDDNGKPVISLPSKINVPQKTVTDLVNNLVSSTGNADLAVKIYVYSLVKSLYVDFSLLTPLYETLVDKLASLAYTSLLYNVFYLSMIDTPYYKHRVTLSNAIRKKFIENLTGYDDCGYGIFSDEEMEYVKRNQHLVNKCINFIRNFITVQD